MTVPPGTTGETALIGIGNDSGWGASGTVQIGCPAPTITSVKPSTWFAGKTYDNVKITGTGFITSDDAAKTGCPVTQVSITAADGSNVPVSGVTVASKTKITLTVAPPDSDPTETATVTVGTAPNTATATAQILGNQILWNGNVISIADGTGPTPQDAVVGQPINLTTPALPSGISATSTTWTVGGTNIGGYTPTAVSAAPPTKTLLKNAALNTYWVYPGSAIPVTYQYCANIPGANPVKQCSLVANAAFNVSGLGDAQMTTDPYSAVVINKIVDRQPCLPGDVDFYLQYGVVTGYDDKTCPDMGGETANPVGIEFTQPEASSSGNYSFVQIVKQSTTIYTEGKNGSLSCPTNPGLDSVYPYPQYPDGTTSDSPSVPLEPFYSKVRRTFKATMYLLWTSNLQGSIPVPIGSQSWQFTQASSSNPDYPSNQSWTQPVWNLIG
jgi:hypothetical protein